MTWIRIDDSFADHPKLIAAGPIAQLIQIRALCYASRHLTDGFIPPGAIPSLIAGMEHIGIDDYGGLFTHGCKVPELDIPALMTGSGLWEKCAGGYQIHDFLDYNPSKLDVLSRREFQRDFSILGGQARLKTAQRNENGTFAASVRPAGTAGAGLEDPTSPPAPTPTPNKKPPYSPPKTPRKSAQATVESMVEKFRDAPVYARLNVRSCIERCKMWCDTNGKTFSKQRVVNWLNTDAEKAERQPRTESPPFRCLNLT